VNCLDSGGSVHVELPWSVLSPGQTVAVVAPAGPVDATKMERGLARLLAAGISVAVGRSLQTAISSGPSSGRIDGFLSASDDLRAYDLQWALSSPDVSAVWAARGGYGVQRILDTLDWSAIGAARPRPVLGFSDVTALHAALRIRVGWPSLLAVNIESGLGGEQVDELSVTTALDALRRSAISANLFAESSPIRHLGFMPEFPAGSMLVSAPMIGGNLTMLAASVGTIDGQPPTEPFIALLEDVTEAPYRLDRSLTQLLRSGWFRHAAAVICGTFERCGQLGEAEAVVVERLAHLGVPIVATTAFGHSGRHVAIPLGIDITIDLGTGLIAAASASGRSSL
jgi:muramoyltetrapeptide carboxypeptidase